MFVFAYGSLLDPASLARTLPGVDLTACVPARLGGFTRSFSVAFRNDGTHPDKRYVDKDGRPPPVVLFCDLVRATDRTVNGVCVPVDEADFARLQARELRYVAIDVTGDVTAPATNFQNVETVLGAEGFPDAEGFLDARDFPAAEVHVFVGRDIHRAAEDVAGGVVADHYLASIRAGAAHWESVAPGFLDEFHASTALPDASIVHALTRIDR